MALALSAAGRLASVYEPDANNSLTVQTSYTYTVTDALASVSEGAQSRSYVYDGMGRLTSVTTPETQNLAVSYTYDQYNNVLSRTDARGVVASYTYDTLNRLIGISYNVGSTGVPATPTVGFSYGTSATQYNNGRLITMTDGLGSENYSYNNLGEITQVQKVVNGTTYTAGYAYNLAGELSSITYPSGRVVSQSYDTIGRLAKVFDSVNTYASGFGYNAASELTALSYGNGVTASFGYSPDRLQLTSLAYTKGTSTLFSLGYNYGAAGSNNGQIQSVTDNVDSGRTVSYTYDNLARLASAVTNGDTSYPKWGLSFSYDRYGNRTNQTVTAGSAPSNSVTVDLTTNRISQSPYAYDANGNMTNDGQNNSMVYDAENRLVSINAGSATYSYDGKSLRVEKIAGGTTTVYIFSGSRVVAEYGRGAAPSAPTREYIYSGSQLLAKVEGGVTSYYHADQLSVRLMSDSSGNVIGQQGHYPFGESWYQTNTTTKWMFTTYERDSESGNDYATFRYDVNRLGRFASPDPLAGSAADPQSLNRYAYVLNDPVNLVDPLGLHCNWWRRGEGAEDPDCERGGVGLEMDEACGGPFSLACDGGTVYLVDGIPVSAGFAQSILRTGTGAVCEGDCGVVEAHTTTLCDSSGSCISQTVLITPDMRIWVPSSTVSWYDSATGASGSWFEPASYTTLGQVLADPFGTGATQSGGATGAGSDQTYTQAKLAALGRAGQLASGPVNAAFYTTLAIALIPVAPEAPAAYGAAGEGLGSAEFRYFPGGISAASEFFAGVANPYAAPTSPAGAAGAALGLLLRGLAGPR